MFVLASAFNQDVSNWNTGAVTSMYRSKCTLSPYFLWPRLPLYVFEYYVFEYMYDNSSFIGSQFTHFLLFVFCFGTVLFVVCGGLVFLFFVAPSLLAVFDRASVFNQDVSKWNTGAVTNMGNSKCILSLSLSLWPRLPLCCVF